jgi:hypothetical protein
MLIVLLLGVILLAGLLALWRSPQMPRYWLLLVIAAIPQIASIFGSRSPALFLISVVALAIWFFCNWKLAGVPLVALGIGLNLLVMAFYGGSMPIRADILAQSGSVVPSGVMLLGSKNVVVQSSPLWLLSDWIVLIVAGSWKLIASPGDLIAFVGIIWWLLWSRRVEQEPAYVPLSQRIHRFLSTIGRTQ